MENKIEITFRNIETLRRCQVIATEDHLRCLYPSTFKITRDNEDSYVCNVHALEFVVMLGNAIVEMISAMRITEN